ncbi:hypothetical protein B0H11DRAFT_2228893 [Mycena galericulata]|nr:hypothetical protein B0H11DRAFT_2228893 [Mycena galericulata]
MHLPSIAVFALLCISHLTAAAPVPTADVDARAFGQSKIAVPPTPQQMIAQGMSNTPRKYKAFFWSGPEPPPAGLRRVRNVATSLAETPAGNFDYVRIMLTAKGNALINLAKDPGITAECQAQFWDNASEAFAELVTGQVALLLDPTTGPAPDPSSVSEQIERPVLEQRLSAGLVTGVDWTARDFATTGTKVPFTLYTLCPIPFRFSLLLIK